MCGILGLFASRGVRVSLDEHAVGRMRDRIAHRGPDGRGTWFSSRGDAVLAHRRLAVVEPPPSQGGAQPMISACGRYTLVYNGELYNDAELRALLSEEGVPFHTHCDTETVLAALIAWGADALARFRGMFALALYDHQRHTQLLARDPLGIKPLYYTMVAGGGGGGGEFIFASEISALLAHPRVSARPDDVTVSAYLSTIRTTLGGRTLYAGISTLMPGEAIRVRGEGEEGVSLEPFHAAAPWYNDHVWSVDDDNLAAIPAEDAAHVRELIGESVRLHLRSDVPTCCLLSGGLDSSIITHHALQHLGNGGNALRTFAAGAQESLAQPGSDLDVARRVAAQFKTTHDEAVLTAEGFIDRWSRMVESLGVPLGTPNEVAIYEVAARLRASGCIVTLSGEGADELFAGYEPALAAIAGVCAQHPTMHPGSAHLAATAWNPPPSAGAVSMKPTVLNDAFWRRAEEDVHLLGHYRDLFESASLTSSSLEYDPAARPLAAHQLLLRKINLTGLLQRLDTSTMLAGVEGRTPFADAAVAACADSLPMAWRCILPAGPGQAGQTKRILRAAYADVLPREVIERPKASFPLPFQEWVGGGAAVQLLQPKQGSYLEEIVRPQILAEVYVAPTKYWQWAWPLMNLALWSRRFD